MTAAFSAEKKPNILRMVILAVLAALIVLLMLTGIGYIPIGPGFTITILSLPVAVGAILLGPSAGAILGAVFGLTSFATCFLGMDAFGVALLAVSPFKTAVVCLIPRILAGFLCGMIFKGLEKIDKTCFISYAVSSLSAAALNTVFFLGALWLLFGSDPTVTQYTGGSSNIWLVFVVLGGINAIIESAACLILGTAITKSVAVATKKMKLKA